MNAMDRILELTTEVEQQIGRGDWLAAAETDAERRSLLVTLLERQDPGRLAPHEQQSLREVLQRTNDAAAGIGAMKRELLATSDQLRTAPRALRSYRQNRKQDPLAQLRD